MRITDASKEKLKAGSISKVIEQLGSKLKKVGREYVTQCIWHDDTNPSLTINDDKGFCFCHVCRNGGDVIEFTRQRKGLDFVDAANLAAEILGIELETDGISPEERARRKQQRQDSLEKLRKDQQRWQAGLHDFGAEHALEILEKRGINQKAIQEFGLGYASDGFFAGRITIPIENHRGELVGWTGRATGDQPAKYKNSQDSDLFQKKFLVYNEARAKEAARLTGSLIFVEGHLDVVSLWQHGIANAVAMQGTGAPDPAILERLTRSVGSFTLCFDGDEGGNKAIQQFISVAGPMAHAGKIQINVAKMPDGKDPDEVCRESGADGFYGLIANAVPWLDWIIDHWVTGLDKANSAAMTDVEAKLKQVINKFHSAAVRAHYIDKAARALSSTPKQAKEIVKNWGSFPDVKSDQLWTPRSKEKSRIVIERRMLRIFVHRPDLRDELRPLLANVTHPPLMWLCERLEELERYSATDLTPHSVMAVIAVSEPHFMQQLRTVAKPSVVIDARPDVLQHLHRSLN